MKKIFLHIFSITFIILASTIFAQDLHNVKIGIVYSEKTKQLIYAQNDEFYPIQDWELFFLNRKISYTVVNDEALDENDFEFLDLLILPSVEVLSEEAKENLQNFLNKGKGLFILGNIGIYNKDGRNSYSNFISKLAGFSIEELNTADRIAERHSLQYQSVLGRNISANNDLLVLNRYPPLAAKVIDKGIIRAGKYVSEIDNEKQTVKPGIILSEKFNGRIVWYGFQLSQIIGNKKQENIVEKLIFNSIDWLSPNPILMLKPLPGKYKVAVIISNIITDINSISIASLERYYSNNVSANFFIDAKEFGKHESGVGKFALAGDINLFLGNKFSEEKLNFTVLEPLYDKLKLNNRQKYFGIKLGNSQYVNTYNDSTLSPFNFYLLSDNSFHFTEGKELIAFTGSFSLTKDNPEQLIKDLSLFCNKAENDGEVVLINFIDQTKWSSKSIDENLFSLITEYLTKNYAWITTYSDLINWELSRNKVLIKSINTFNKNSFTFQVENHSQNEIRNLGLQLILPAGKFIPKLSQANLSMKYDPRLKSHLIVIPELKAGRKQTIELILGDEG